LIPEDTLKCIGGTVEDLYRLFNSNKWGPATKLKSREISLCLLYKGESASEAVQEENSDEDQPRSKRMRTRNQPPVPVPSTSQVRMSRFRYPSAQLPKAIRWNRDPTMVSHHYVALELREGPKDRPFDVRWVEKIGNTMEGIEIAIMESWADVMISPELAYQTNSGFIGEGFSKIAVYVSYSPGGGLLLLTYDGENRRVLRVKNTH
jgi:hypothetical protein